MSGVTVIVPSVSGAERLPRLLASLLPTRADPSSPAEGRSRGGAAPATIVVDNGSRGGAVSVACEPFPFVETLRLEENVGFSRAINQAVRIAAGDAIVLLNDDCVCEAGFIERLIAPLDSAQGVVMSAGVLRSPGTEPLIDTAGIELDHTLLGFDYLNGEPLACLDVGVADPLGPCAAAAAYDRDSFLDVGGLDEALFAYWEDVDLALRLRMAGGTCSLAAHARGVHEHSATLAPGSARKAYLMGFGRGYILRKWGALAPRRVPAVLARDIPICLGQLALDRTAAGVKGRLRGFRAARDRKPYPEPALAGAPPASTLAATLRRRAARRRRVRRSLRPRSRTDGLT